MGKWDQRRFTSFLWFKTSFIRIFKRRPLHRTRGGYDIPPDLALASTSPPPTESPGRCACPLYTAQVHGSACTISSSQAASCSLTSSTVFPPNLSPSPRRPPPPSSLSTTLGSPPELFLEVKGSSRAHTAAFLCTMSNWHASSSRRAPLTL